MACARVSERLVVTGRIAAAARSPQVPHPAPIKSLPFGDPFKLVAVGSRSRPSTDLLSSDGTSLFQSSRCLGSVRSGGKLNTSNMMASLRRPELLLVATKQMKFPNNLCGVHPLSPHFANTHVTAPRSAQSLVTAKSALYFTASKESTNQVKPTPNISSENHHPPPSDPDLPSAAQLSFILLKLREELPTFFDGHHSYCLYSPKLLFRNKLFPFQWSTRGRWKYECFLTSTKCLLWCMYGNLNMDVLRITKDPYEGKVEARWRITGRPRIRTEERVVVEGFSVFVVNPEGLISKHKMDRVISSKNTSPIGNFIRRRLETFVSAKQPSLTQTHSNL